jgi:ribosomal protein S18 acetylase RimI-like enzyme
MPHYLWSKMAGPGEDPWEIGRRRAAREEASFSYRNAWMAEAAGNVAGALIGYPLADAPEPIPADMPAMFVPLQELENLAAGTWYVNVVAVYEDHRRKGYGAQLLSEADRIAAQRGSSSLSIIVRDGNDAARRLYDRHGYKLVAQRPMIKETWDGEGSNWLLLVKKSAQGS